MEDKAPLNILLQKSIIYICSRSSGVSWRDLLICEMRLDSICYVTSCSCSLSRLVTEGKAVNCKVTCDSCAP